MHKENLIITIACAILISLAGLSNAAMDKMQFHYSKSIFPKDQDLLLGKSEQFWNPTLSWRNKYKDNDPTKGMKFPMSTGALVFLTDGWHLMQFFMLTFFQLAVTIPLIRLWKLNRWYAILAVLPAKFLFSAVFVLFFHRLLLPRVIKEV